MKWTKLTIDTTVSAVDLLSVFLEDKGVTGIEITDNVPLTDDEKREMYVDIPLICEDDGTAKVSCYIDDGFDIDTLKADIARELTRLKAFIPVGSMKITISDTEDKDWINNWKVFFKTFRIYDDIIIKPKWENISDFEAAEDKQAGYIPPSECTVVNIDPGIAFGTGSHETTKLCIGQIKKYLKKGGTVFDVGCGSGILSIISSMLGAGFVHGMDIDEVAVRASRDNAALNDIGEDRLIFTCGNLLDDNYIGRGTTFELDKNVIKNERHIEADRQYDIVVANILADVIIPLSSVIIPFMKPDAYFIASGILRDKEAAVKEALLFNGFEIVEAVYMNDWVSVTAKIRRKYA